MAGRGSDAFARRPALLVICAGNGASSLPQWHAVGHPAHAQQPTGSIPTVTGTPSGPMVSVDPSLGQIRVYAGPSSFNYPRYRCAADRHQSSSARPGGWALMIGS